jgi:hypothetical protein
MLNFELILSLTLFVFRVFADHAHDAFATDNLAMFTQFFY